MFKTTCARNYHLLRTTQAQNNLCLEYCIAYSKAYNKAYSIANSIAYRIAYRLALSIVYSIVYSIHSIRYVEQHSMHHSIQHSMQHRIQQSTIAYSVAYRKAHGLHITVWGSENLVELQYFYAATLLCAGYHATLTTLPSSCHLLQSIFAPNNICSKQYV